MPDLIDCPAFAEHGLRPDPWGLYQRTVRCAPGLRPGPYRIHPTPPGVCPAVIGCYGLLGGLWLEVRRGGHYTVVSGATRIGCLEREARALVQARLRALDADRAVPPQERMALERLFPPTQEDLAWNPGAKVTRPADIGYGG